MNIDTNKKIQIVLVVIIILLLGYLASTFVEKDTKSPTTTQEEVTDKSDIYKNEKTGLLTVDSVRSSEIILDESYESNDVNYYFSRALKYNPIDSDISERTILNIVDERDLSFGILPNGYKSGLIFEVEVTNNGSDLAKVNLEDLFTVEQIDALNVRFDIFLYVLGDEILQPGATRNAYVAYALPLDAITSNVMFGNKLINLSFLGDTYQVLD